MKIERRRFDRRRQREEDEEGNLLTSNS